MPTANKIVTKEEAIEKISQWRVKGLSVIFTNGCFDILHLGHIDYLEKARNKGDKLIIGLNTDNSIKILKGENRPINSEESRARLLAALEFVDIVVLFEEETPKKLIEYLIPDILVKGNDYKEEDIIGYEFVKRNGGRVETVELVDGFSTTNIIDKIRNS